MPIGTGPNDPWYYNNALGIRIGPFTGSDQSNAAANQRAQQLMGLPGLVAPPVANPTVPGAHTLQQTYGNPVAAALDSTATQPGVTPFPSGAIPRTPSQQRSDQQSVPIINPSRVPSEIYLGGGPEASPSNVPDSAPVVPNPKAAPTPGTGPSVDIPGVGNITAPPTVYDVPTSTEAATHLAASSPGPVDDDLFDKMDKLLQKMGYPAAPSTDNPKQAAADAYAAHEMDRTKLLAQLAFASGLTSSAGGQYEDIGKGFAAAGNVYDQGQQRYLKALQGSADRYADQQKEQYAYKAKKAGVMADLYTAGEKQKLDQAKLVQDAAKDRQDILIRQLGLMKPAKGANDITNPNEDADWQETVSRSLAAGRPIIYRDLTK